MLHGPCPRCTIGSCHFCGLFYRCDRCGYEEQTKVFSNYEIPALNRKADERLKVLREQETSPFAVKNFMPLSSLRSPKVLIEKHVELLEQTKLFDTTDFIGFR